MTPMAAIGFACLIFLFGLVCGCTLEFFDGTATIKCRCGTTHLHKFCNLGPEDADRLHRSLNRVCPTCAPEVARDERDLESGIRELEATFGNPQSRILNPQSRSLDYADAYTI